MAQKTTQAKKAVAKKAADKASAPAQVSSVSSWKKKAEGTIMTFPSGNVARVRNPGLQAFLREGMVPNGLLPIVQTAIDKHVAPTPQEMMQRPQALAETLELMESITMYCVLEPKIHPTPLPGEARDPELLYVDEVDIEDKVFVFQLVGGGTSDLERFRRERSESLAALQSGEALEQTAG